MFDIRALFNVINKDSMMGNNNIKWGGLFTIWWDHIISKTFKKLKHFIYN